MTETKRPPPAKARQRRIGSGKAKRASVETESLTKGGRLRTPERNVSARESKHGARGRAIQSLAPGLYVVATPIGHASDITLRALDVLRAVDAVACEDTRVTARLLTIHGLAKPLTPYHDHNARAAAPALIDRIRRGESVALVSDAGTPLVSDPGYRLVQACIAEGLPVVPVPGASAVLAALCVSGLPTDRFLFAGFPPPQAPARRRWLAELASVKATLVVMESANRLPESLADMADVLGPRQAAIGRELTKMFEEVRRGTLLDLAQHYRESGAPRGEVTVVVAPPGSAELPSEAEVDRRLAEALKRMSPGAAAARLAAETGLPRRRLYARALELKRPRL